MGAVPARRVAPTGTARDLELVLAAGEEADERRLLRLVDSDDEFPVMCGAVGLGRLVAEGDRAQLPQSRDRVLRQALGYCWSVAAAAAPEVGLERLAHLERSDDPDLRWVARENLKKARLERLR